jgi:tetratricopeptide (TPR) repeat protein
MVRLPNMLDEKACLELKTLWEKVDRDAYFRLREETERLIHLLSRINEADEAMLAALEKHVGYTREHVRQMRGRTFCHLGEILFFEAEAIVEADNRDTVDEQTRAEARKIYTDANAWFEKALAWPMKLWPYKPDYFLGAIAYRLGDPEGAIVSLEKAHELQCADSKHFRPHLATITSFLSRAYIQKGRFDDAHARLSQVLQSWPDDIDSNVRMGELFKAKGDLGQAAKYLLRAFLLPPGHNDDKRYVRALATKHFGCFERALPDDEATVAVTVAEVSVAKQLGIGDKAWAFAKAHEPAEIKRQLLAHRVIPIGSAKDFYEKFASIAESFAAIKQKATKRKPLSNGKVSSLTFALFRGERGDVPAPESLKSILRGDSQFSLWGNPKIFQTILRAMKAGCVPSQTVSQALLDSMQARDRKRMPPDVSLWNDGPSMPALIELDTNGGQRAYFYMAEPDEDGEYPIARFDDEPTVWIAHASLIHAVVEYAKSEGVCIECTIDFEAALEQAKKRNRRFEEKEGLSNEGVRLVEGS